MKKGKIELAIGPMFAGKTTWLIQNLEKENTENILSVHYFLDTRYSSDSLATHDGKKLKSIAVKDDTDILKALNKNPQITTLGLDELQFFKPNIAPFLSDLKEKRLNIYTAGLNVDFTNNPWEAVQAVTLIADNVTQLKAICAVCGKRNATNTFRKSKGEEKILIGGSKLYEALCEKDYLDATA